MALMAWSCLYTLGRAGADQRWRSALGGQGRVVFRASRLAEADRCSQAKADIMNHQPADRVRG